MTARQLSLDLPPVDNRSRDDFLVGAANEQALALIDAWPRWPARAVALVGPAGAGKSHLAALFREVSGARVMAAAELTTARVPEALSAGALVLEDLGDGAEAGPLDEAALFHLLNLVQEQSASLLVTSRELPAALAERVATRDLASRLRLMPAVRLGMPDDHLLAAVAVKLFADRQIVPDEALIGYLMARVERSYAAIGAVIAELDREALARRRPLTRALAAELLRARETPTGGTDEEAPASRPEGEEFDFR